MKKITLSLLMLACSLFTAKASHLMGGEIVAHVDSNNTAHFVFTLYRDIMGPTAGLGTTQALTLVGGASTNTNVTVNRISLDTLKSSYLVERHIYTGSFQLSGSGSYSATWSSCCRNAGILNVTNSSSESFYLNTEFTSYNGSSSSTPVFLNAPVLNFPKDTIWTYNPLPFDADGDSLYWTIDTPLTSQSQYITGYTTPPGNVGGALSMDPQTGVISWSASQVGNYVTSILVEEYRNGNKIGEIRRDMQFIVVPDTSSMQVVVPPALAGGGTPSASISPGQSSSFVFELKSTNSSAPLKLEARGEPFEIPNSNASFQVQPTSGSDIQGTFTWNPAQADARTAPYSIALRASDGNLVYDLTVLLTVYSTVGIEEEINTSKLNIYPNPGNGDFKVSINRADQPMSIQVIDMQGKLIKEISVDSHNWTEELSLELKAIPGTYILKLNGDEPMSKLFIIE